MTFFGASPMTGDRMLFAVFQAFLVVWYGYTWPIREILYPFPP